jgi:hypothetical protein
MTIDTAVQPANRVIRYQITSTYVWRHLVVTKSNLPSFMHTFLGKKQSKMILVSYVPPGLCTASACRRLVLQSPFCRVKQHTSRVQSGWVTILWQGVTINEWRLLPVTFILSVLQSQRIVARVRKGTQLWFFHQVPRLFCYTLFHILWRREDDEYRPPNCLSTKPLTIPSNHC